MNGVKRLFSYRKCPFASFMHLNPCILIGIVLSQTKALLNNVSNSNIRVYLDGVLKNAFLARQGIVPMKSWHYYRVIQLNLAIAIRNVKLRVKFPHIPTH